MLNDFSNLQGTPEYYELNQAMKSVNQDNLTPELGKFVEIFSAIIDGKSTSRFGTNGAVNALKHYKSMTKAAADGNMLARTELNSVRKIVIETGINNSIPLMTAMGNVIRVGHNEEVKYNVYELTGDKSQIQAGNGAFVKPTSVKRTQVMQTENITGGVIENYQENRAGNTDIMSKAKEEVVKDMNNQMVVRTSSVLRTGISTATTMTNYAAGISQSNVDAVLALARRWGKVSILGDIDALETISNYAKFLTTTSTYQWSEEVMRQIMNNGLIGFYKGSAIVEMPNPYDLTSVIAAGTYFDTFLPKNVIYFTTQGAKGVSPLQIGIKGGITSMTGNDVNTGQVATRYDLQFGTALIPEYYPMMGLIIGT